MTKIAGDAVYLLQQDYYITDTTVKERKRYGLNKQEYFGRFYFLSIVANGHFYVDAIINTPWKLDQNFKSISTKNKYQAVLGKLAFSKLNQVNFQHVDSSVSFNESRNSLMNVLDEYSMIKAPDSLKSFFVINPNDSTILDNTSWFWTASVLDTSKLNGGVLLSDQSKIEFESSKGKYQPSKKSFINNAFFYDDKTIGGFIFTTKASFGKVEYFLSGLTLKKDGKFVFIAINSFTTAEKELPIKSPKSTESSELQINELEKSTEKPIKNKKKTNEKE